MKSQNKIIDRRVQVKDNRHSLDPMIMEKTHQGEELMACLKHEGTHVFRLLESFRTELEKVKTGCIDITNALKSVKVAFPGTDAVDVSEINSRNTSLIGTYFKEENDRIPLSYSYFEPVKLFDVQIFER